MKTYSQTQRILLRIFAEGVFVIHFVVVLITAVGWIFPGTFFYVYLTAWFLAFAVDMLWSTCPLTYLEFSIRKKLDPHSTFDKFCIAHYMRTWRGLSPRPFVETKDKTFWGRYSFVFIMLGLLVLSLLWQALVYGRDIFYFA